MTAQADYELDHGNTTLNWNYQPVSRTWNKGDQGAAPGGPSPPQVQVMQRAQTGQMMVAQPVVSQQRIFQVQCPAGVGPGAQIRVTTPEGVQMGVAVPHGVMPGDVFQVVY